MIQGESTFQSIYSKLNPAQKQAVDTIDGPVMVMAGPGTGKTQVLAARIANILLKTDEKPSNILALTFTDSAAKNMRERVVQMIGKEGYYVHITTFHAFCKDVIETHPEYFSQSRDAQALTQIERFELFQTILHETELDILKPINAPLFYLKDIIKAISDLKKEGVTSNNLELIIQNEEFVSEKETKSEKLKREKAEAKQKELAVIYKIYQDKLKELERYDFDDMIMFVMDAFEKHEELLLEYQENFHYFLVDEYQDTNSAQNAVVHLLASFWAPAANIFVVGDPNQSIYRFQGASVENMLGFIDEYPDAEVVTLDTGYRSTQTIYNAAHELIGNNTLTQLSKKSEILHANQILKSVHDAGSKITLLAAASDTVETVSVVDQISNLIINGIKPEEIAVIYRNNSDVIPIQELLYNKKIRFEIASGINILNTSEIQQLLTFLQLLLAIRTGDDTSKLFQVLSFEWLHLRRVAVLELARFSGKHKSSIIEVLEKGYDFYKEHCDTCLIQEDDWIAITTKLNEMKLWSLDELTNHLPQWFTQVIDASGYIDWLKARDESLELLLHLNSFFAELKSQLVLDHELKLEGFLNSIALMTEHGLSIQADDLNIKEGAVTLTTAHSAKGQEWEHVFIIRCVDGKWGNSRKRDLLPLPKGILKNTDLSKKEMNEDDRRLFYVAMTRAKKQLTISYPKSYIESSKTKEQLASMFIGEIEKYIQDETTSQTEKVAQATEVYLSQLLAPPILEINDTDEKTFFTKVVKDFSLSITALNDYLRDPQLFVYKHLLRVPESHSEAQIYGTAMHRALEYLYRQWCIEKTEIVIPTVLEVFETSLAQESLSIQDFDRRLEKGKQNLKAYIKYILESEPEVIVLEKMFGRGLSQTFLDDIPLNGRIDRIDWLDSHHHFARVIDYKTGRPKTLNEIEGKTATAQKEYSQREKELPESIRGPYKRQLLFYKILTELDTSFKPIITEGEFDFVEPDKDKGIFIKRTIPLLEEDVISMKTLIKEVMTDIRKLAFLSS